MISLLLNSSESPSIDHYVRELLSTSSETIILSPYLTRNGAIDVLLGHPNPKSISLIINLNEDSVQHGAIDLNLILQLIDKGIMIKSHSQLHAKVYLGNDLLILGSANFTNSGLKKKEEACIRISRQGSPKLFEETKAFCIQLMMNSEVLLKENIQALRKSLGGYNLDIKEDEWIEHQEKNWRARMIQRYEENFPYPKTLYEFSPGLKFDHVNHQDVEDTYNRFPTSGRKKDEIATFLRTEVYENNKGYGLRTKLDGKATNVMMWYRRNASSLDFQLKSYQQEFMPHRRLELLRAFQAQYNVEPIFGYFANIFKKVLKKEEFNFSITLKGFLTKCRIEEVDDFFRENGKAPGSHGRSQVSYRKNNGNPLATNEEKELLEENRLNDQIRALKKELERGSNESLILEYLTKWGIDI